MISIALGHLEAIFSWLLAASWQASVLALLVLLIQTLCRNRLNPRWRYALWLLVLARLVLPALPESALSLFQFAPPPPQVLVTPVIAPLFVAIPISLPAVSTPAPVPLPEPSYPFSIYTLLALTWLTGAVLLFLLTWQVNRRFARQVDASPEITDPDLRDLFVQTRAELGMQRSIRLIESTHVQSPAIMGLFRPTLLLPANVREAFDRTELRLVFLHELAHLKRGDVIVQGLIALLQILHWFNPVLWFAFRRMRADREPATDALVLSRAGEEEKERYGLMLIKLLENFNHRHSLPTLVGILEDKDQFKRRFTLIARFTRGAYGWSLLGVLIIGLLAVACLTAKKKDEAKSLDKASVPPIYVSYDKIGAGFFGPVGRDHSLSDDSHLPGTNHTLSVYCPSNTETAATLVFTESWPSGPPQKTSHGEISQPMKENKMILQVPLKKAHTFQIFDSIEVTTSPVLAPDPSDLTAARQKKPIIASLTDEAPLATDSSSQTPIYVRFDKISSDFFGPVELNNDLTDNSYVPGTDYLLSVHCSSMSSSQATLVFSRSWPTGTLTLTNPKLFPPVEVQIPLGKAHTFRIFDSIDVTTSSTPPQPKTPETITSPITNAICSGDAGLVKRLLDQGETVTPMDMGTALSIGTPAMVKILWDHGAHLCSEMVYAISQNESLDQLKALLASGAPTTHPFANMTPLSMAARRGNIETAQWLLDHGADINYGSGGGFDTALTAAAHAQDVRMADFLLKKGAKADRWTLNQAVAWGDFSNPESTEKTLATVRWLLIKAGPLQILSIDDKVGLLIQAGEKGSPELLQIYLDAGIDPLTKRTDGKTALSVLEDAYSYRDRDPSKAVIKPALDALQQAQAAPGVHPPNAISQGSATDPYIDFQTSLVTFKLDPTDPKRAEQFRAVLKNPYFTWEDLHKVNGFIQLSMQPNGRIRLSEFAPVWKLSTTIPLNEDRFDYVLYPRLVNPTTVEITACLEPKDAKGTSLGPIVGTWTQPIDAGGALLLSLGEQTVIAPQADGSKLACLALVTVRKDPQADKLFTPADKITEVNLWQVPVNADTTSLTSKHNSQMLEAVQKGDVAVLQKLLDQGLDPDAAQSNPIYWAVYYHQPEILKLLLAHDADATRISSGDNEDPLELARKSHPDLVPILQQGIDLNRPKHIAKVKAKIESIHIDSLIFKDTPLNDIISALQAKTRQLDPAGEGLNFVARFKPNSPTSPENLPPAKLTLTLTDVPLTLALDAIAKAAKLQYSTEEFAIYFHPAGDGGEPLTVRTFLIPHGFFKVEPKSSAITVDVKQEFMSRGIDFPPGASATFLPGSRKLVMRNTPTQEDKIQALVDKATALSPLSNTPPTSSFSSADLDRLQQSLFPAPAQSTPLKTNILPALYWLSDDSPYSPPTSYYVALPFNDLAHPDLAKTWVPSSWVKPVTADRSPRSACDGHWVKLTNTAGISCYAQWEGVGPWSDDDAAYVFGDGHSKGTTGIELSPATAQFLGTVAKEGTTLGEKNPAISWQFVDEQAVPPGPWLSDRIVYKLPDPTPLPLGLSATPEPSSAKPIASGDEVRTEVRVAYLSEDDYQAHRAEIDAAVQNGDLAPLAQLKSYQQVSNMRLFGKPGQQGVIEAVRVLPHPISWERNAKGQLAPNDFKRKNIGVRFVFHPTIVNDKINITGFLEISSLERWESLGEDAYKPVLHTHMVMVSGSFLPGQTGGLQLPGGPQMEPTDPTFYFLPNKIPDVSKNPKALRRVFLFLTLQNASATSEPSAKKPLLDILENADKKPGVKTTYSKAFAPLPSSPASIPSEANPIPATPSNPSIQVNLWLAEIDEATYTANQKKIDVALKKGDVTVLTDLKGVSLLTAPSETTPSGQKVDLEIAQEFPFPTSFENDKNGKPIPSHFETRDVGVKAALTPVQNQDFIQLTCNFSIVDFDGFASGDTNSPSTYQPTFSTREAHLLLRCDKNGQPKGELLPGGRLDEQTVTDKDSSGKVISTTKQVVKKRLVVFLSTKPV